MVLEDAEGRFLARGADGAGRHRERVDESLNNFLQSDRRGGPECRSHWKSRTHKPHQDRDYERRSGDQGRYPNEAQPGRNRTQIDATGKKSVCQPGTQQSAEQHLS